MDPNTVQFTIVNNNLPSGNILCLYNFKQENYDNDDRILSSWPAQTFTSGQINENTPNSFTGTIGSGNFEDAYVEINNSSDYFNAPCSFIFSLDKKNREPVSIFNNIQNVETTGSGYAFGMNAANNIWFKTFDKNQPTIRSSNFASVAKHNLWALSVNDSSLSIRLFDPHTTGFESTGFLLDRNVLQNQVGLNCQLGSGEYNSKYFLDYFVAISGNISDTALYDLCQNSYQEYFYNDDVSGAIVDPVSNSGVATGNQVLDIPSGTGIMYKNVFSGYVENTKTFVTSTGQPLTGGVPNLVSGETIIYSSVSSNIEPFNDTLYVSDGLISQSPHVFYETFFSDGTESGPQITGWSGSGESINVKFSGEVYVASGATGFTDSRFTVSGVTGDSGTYLLSGASSGVRGDFPNKYNLSDLVFLGTSGSGNDIGEFALLEDPTVFNKTLNRGMNNAPGSLASSLSFTFPDGKSYLSGDRFSGAIQMNGATQYQGLPNRYLDEFRATQIKITGGNYYITGNVIVSRQMVNMSYYSLYDSQSILNKAFDIITGTGWITAANVSPNDSQVYLNGQKIYSGIDYQSIGGTFTVISSANHRTDISGTSGLLFGYDNYSGYVSNTGIELHSLYDQSFPRNGFMYYLNGIRAHPSDCAQYSKLNSFLTGVEIYRNTTNILYSNNVL